METESNNMDDLRLYKVERQRSTGVVKRGVEVQLDTLVRLRVFERVQEIKDAYGLGDYSLGDYFTSLMLNDPIMRAKIEAAQAMADADGAQRSYLRIMPLEGRRPR